MFVLVCPFRVTLRVEILDFKYNHCESTCACEAVCSPAGGVATAEALRGAAEGGRGGGARRLGTRRRVRRAGASSTPVALSAGRV